MNWILSIRYALWGPFTVALIAATGLLLTFRTRGIQFWCIRRLFSSNTSNQSGGISPFQALCTSLGGTLGVGNLAGVATALTLGGPGSVFWILFAALLGMATKYSELLLAVKYRIHTPEPLGGPMVYLSRGAKLPFLAKIFAVCCVICAFGSGAAAQGSAIAEALAPITPLSRGTIAFLVSLVLLPILYGGGQLIARVSSILVPIMTLGYLGMGMAVLIKHFSQIPTALQLIFTSAWEPLACGGGIVGLLTARAISNGFAKGIFSNEAGMGSAPIAHGCSNSTSPCAEGMLGAVEVFIDTCVVCLMTALVLLTTGAWQSGSDGLTMTTQAFSTILGNYAPWFIGVIVVFLACSTVLGWSFYGLACLKWLKAPTFWIQLYPFGIVIAAALAGCIPLTTLLLITDIFAACMSFPNLIGLWILSDEVATQTKQFLSGGK